MFIHHSASTNGSHPSQLDSFSLYLYHYLCFDSITGVYIYAAYALTYFILIIPLSIYILHMGYQRWKRHQSSAATTSHSDFYTYNIAAVDLIGMLGSLISTYGSFSNLADVTVIGVFISSFPWSAHMLYPILICMENYWAVVHPITYLWLKQAGGMRMRNISTVIVWLQPFVGLGWMIASTKYPQCSVIPAGVVVLCVLIATFCSVSILRVLIRPRPGEAVGNRVQADQSKKRAFKIVVLIMGVLLFKFGGQLALFLIYPQPTWGRSLQCVLTASTVWYNLPSSLVLPLLFLHKAGKLSGCKRCAKSG